MRRMNRPPWRRANSQLKKAVRTPPMCRKPVGLGAKRVRIMTQIILRNMNFGGAAAKTCNLRDRLGKCRSKGIRTVPGGALNDQQRVGGCPCHLAELRLE